MLGGAGSPGGGLTVGTMLKVLRLGTGITAAGGGGGGGGGGLIAANKLDHRYERLNSSIKKWR